MTGIFIRERRGRFRHSRTNTHTQGRRPGDNSGRGWSNAATSQGVPGATPSYQSRKGPPLECPLDVSLLPSGLWEDMFLLFWATQFGVRCHGSPRKRIQSGECVYTFKCVCTHINLPKSHLGLSSQIMGAVDSTAPQGHKQRLSTCQQSYKIRLKIMWLSLSRLSLSSSSSVNSFSMLLTSIPSPSRSETNR